ncbi:C4-dicarboxylate ABC transporter permease [Alkalihalophilus pseudofirmus]|nr:C4-dicarboxylate ABC transporter permease [Alkalihalophilus pseudofirmus]
MRKAIKGMNQTLNIILVLIFVVLTVAVFCQIIFRFVLNQPLAWTEELSRYSLVWITFLGAAFAMSKNAHIGMEVLRDRAPAFLKKVLAIVAAVVCLGFFFIMIKEGYSLAGRSMNQLSPVLKIPMGIVYSVIPISGVILAINIIDVTIRQLRQREEG